MLGHIRGMRAILATGFAFLAASCLAHAAPIKIHGEAYLGEPFGVGCVEVELPASQAPEPLGWPGLGIDG